MTSKISYWLGFLAIILTTSQAVLEEDDPCITQLTCQSCVVTKTNMTAYTGSNRIETCVFVVTVSGLKCVKEFRMSEEVNMVVYAEAGCVDISTTPPPNHGP